MDKFDVPAVYLDSVVLLDILAQDPAHRSTSRFIIDECESGKLAIVASELVIAEVGASKKKATVSHVDIDAFFANSYFEFASVDRLTARTARGIAFEHGLKPPDAIHVATCMIRGCPIFLTRDGGPTTTKPNRKAGLMSIDGKLFSASGPLRVMTPTAYMEAQGLLC